MKTKSEILTEDQQDALQEMMNISFGMASAILSDSIHSFSRMPIPRIALMQTEELEEYLNTTFASPNPCYIVTQVFRNKFDGESIFIMEEASANIITSLLMEEPLETLEDEDIQSTVLEITNIISSACIGKLMELLKAQIFFSPPVIVSSCKIGENVIKLSKQEKRDYTKVIIIESKLEFEKEHITGYLIFLTKEASFEWLKKALDDLLERSGYE